nr:dehydratase [Propionibacterium sp.]
MTDLSTVAVGTELPALQVTFDRQRLVRYAGASGDFNPIHYSDHHARALGLAGCLAHGMLTMGVGLRVVTDWCVDPGRVRRYSVRFTKPVQVPDDDAGAVVHFTARVSAIEDAVATVAIDARCGEDKVLGAAVAEVSLA